jgi:acetate kinase
VVVATTVERWDGADTSPITTLAAEAGPLDAVGHRIVHGGSRPGPVALDATVEAELRALTTLAPLHQPRALAGVAAARAALPGVPQVACFDTSFHSTLPAAASTYAVPAAWRQRWPIRRYGFHGLSHASAGRRAGALLGRTDDPTLRLVTAHLGSGSSLSAILGGRSVDTTMGFTPLEGLVMARRSGSVDPGLVLWLVNEAGLDPRQVEAGLDHDGGLAALAQLPDGSGDLRDIVAAASSADPAPAAALALDVWVHSVRREVGAMIAALGGIDALVFTGGVGQHQPGLRARVVDRLGYLGLQLDESANQQARPDEPDADRDVSAPEAPGRVLVLAADEEGEIARAVEDLLGA